MKKALVAFLILVAAMVGGSSAIAAQPESKIPVSFRIQLAELEGKLAAQEEARASQADAFDAAATRIEFVNAALVAVIALAGIVAGFLAFKWVGRYTQDQVKKQIDAGAREAGKEIFEKIATELRDEYEEKFADAYKRYNEVGERGQQ